MPAKPLPVVTGTAVAAPRWPRGLRAPFVAGSGNRPTPSGCVNVWVEGGQTPPFLFADGWSDPLSPNLSDDARIDAALAKVVAARPGIVAWDVEHVPMADERTIRLHLKLIKRLRALDPDILQTAYGAPITTFWPFINDESRPIAELRAANDRLAYGQASTGRRYPDRGLIQACDSVSPSLYLRYPDRDQLAGGATQRDFLASDAVFLRRNLEEAFRVAQGKPVLAWVMSTVHETGEPLIAERLRQAFAIIVERGAHPVYYRETEGDARVAEVVGLMRAALA